MKEEKKITIPFIAVLIVVLILGIIIFLLNRKYTVMFYSNGGSHVESQIVHENGKANKPEDPTKEGYTFLGWYYIENDDVEYNFDDKVKENIVLIAKWEWEEKKRPITAINITSEKNEIEISEEIQLKADILPAERNNEISQIIWTSSDEDVATISNEGKVTAVKEGKAVITATIDNISNNIEITIKKPIEPEIQETKPKTPSSQQQNNTKPTTQTTQQQNNTTPNTPISEQPNTTPTTPTQQKTITYSASWEKIETSIIGQYYLYIVSSEGKRVSGTATVTTKSGVSETVSIPTSGKIYVKDTIASVSNIKAN